MIKFKRKINIIFSLILVLLMLFIIFYINKEKKVIIINNKIINKELNNNILNIKENIDKNNSIEKISLNNNDIIKLINKQKFDEVLPILENKYNNDQTNLANILNYANTLANIGSITRKEKIYGEKSLDVLNKALKIDKNNSEIYRIMGYSNEIMEKYNEAFSNYNKSIELNEKNAMAYSNRGHAYKLIGNTSLAKKDFLKAYSLNDNIDHNLANLANIYLGEANYDKALKFYNKLLENSLNIRFKSEALFSVGNIYLSDKKYIEATNTFNEAIKTDSNFELGYIGLARVQFLIFLEQVKNKEKVIDNNLVDLAILNNNKAIKINPNKTLAYYQLALLYMDVGYYNETDKNLQKALTVLPNDLTLSKIEKEVFKNLINKQYNK